MLIGKLAAITGLLGLVAHIAAIALQSWQTAPGGETMGLWQLCDPSCSSSKFIEEIILCGK